MAKIGIRCDCDIRVGAGHLAQQTLIAEELQKIGHEVSFYIESGEAIWQSELKRRRLGKLKREDLLIIDLLDLDDFPAFAGKKIVFHCHPTKELFDANLVFAGSVLQKQEWYGDVKYFVGPRYKPMEPEIGEINHEFGKLNNILIMTSGADVWNIPHFLLKHLGAFNGEMIAKIPSQFSAEQVGDLKTLRPGIDISYRNDHVYPLYKWADLLITTAGNAMIEAAASRLPCITIAITDTQDEIAKFMEKVGYSIHLGKYQNGLNLAKLSLGLDLLCSVRERIKRTKVGKRVCDGKGLERCVRKIQELL